MPTPTDIEKILAGLRAASQNTNALPDLPPGLFAPPQLPDVVDAETGETIPAPTPDATPWERQQYFNARQRQMREGTEPQRQQLALRRAVATGMPPQELEGQYEFKRQAIAQATGGEGHTTRQFFKNAAVDAANMLTGFMAIPGLIGKVATDPNVNWLDEGDQPGVLSQIGEAVKQEYGQAYGGGLSGYGEAVYERPVSRLLDVLVVASLGGAGAAGVLSKLGKGGAAARAAQVARGAAGGMAATDIPSIAQAAGGALARAGAGEAGAAGAAARGVGGALETAGRYAGYLDPSRGIPALVGAGVKSPAGQRLLHNIGMDTETVARRKMASREKAEFFHETRRGLQSIIQETEGLTEEEGRRVIDMITLGKKNLVTEIDPRTNKITKVDVELNPPENLVNIAKKWKDKTLDWDYYFQNADDPDLRFSAGKMLSGKREDFIRFADDVGYLDALATRDPARYKKYINPQDGSINQEALSQMGKDWGDDFADYLGEKFGLSREQLDVLKNLDDTSEFAIGGFDPQYLPAISKYAFPPGAHSERHLQLLAMTVGGVHGKKFNLRRMRQVSHGKIRNYNRADLTTTLLGYELANQKYKADLAANIARQERPVPGMAQKVTEWLRAKYPGQYVFANNLYQQIKQWESKNKRAVTPNEVEHFLTAQMKGIKLEDDLFKKQVYQIADTLKDMERNGGNIKWGYKGDPVELPEFMAVDPTKDSVKFYRKVLHYSSRAANEVQRIIREQGKVSSKEMLDMTLRIAREEADVRRQASWEKISEAAETGAEKTAEKIGKAFEREYKPGEVVDAVRADTLVEKTKARSLPANIDEQLDSALSLGTGIGAERRLQSSISPADRAKIMSTLRRHKQSLGETLSAADEEIINAAFNDFSDKAYDAISKNFYGKMPEEITRKLKAELKDRMVQGMSPEDALAKRVNAAAARSIEGKEYIGAKFEPTYITTAEIANEYKSAVGAKQGVLGYAYETANDAFRYALLAGRPAWFFGNQAGNTLLYALDRGVLNTIKDLPDIWRFIKNPEKIGEMIDKGWLSPSAATGLFTEAMTRRHPGGMLADNDIVNFVEGIRNFAETTDNKAIKAALYVPRANINMNQRFEQAFRAVRGLRGLEETLGSKVGKEKAKTLYQSMMAGMTIQDYMANNGLNMTRKNWDQMTDLAADIVDKALLDYSNFSPLERRFFRKLFPISYAFWRGSTALAFTLPVTHPRKAWMINRIGQAFDEAKGDEEIPPYLHNAIDLGKDEKGNRTFWNITAYNPFGQIATALRKSAEEGTGILGAVAGVTLGPEAFSPVIKGLLEWKTGYNFFKQQPYTSPGLTKYGGERAQPSFWWTGTGIGGTPQARLIHDLVAAMQESQRMGEFISGTAYDTSTPWDVQLYRTPGGEVKTPQSPFRPVQQMFGYSPVKVNTREYAAQQQKEESARVNRQFKPIARKMTREQFRDRALDFLDKTRRNTR